MRSQASHLLPADIDAADAGITPVRRGNLATVVAHQLSNLILSGKFEGGDRLPTHGELARQFGVSVATIREAVAALARVGALEVRLGVGTFVRANGAEPEDAALSFGLPTEAGDLAEFTEMRAIIDGGLSRLAAVRCTAEDAIHLRGLVTELETAIDDPDRFLELDLAMHVAVAKAARNKPLLRWTRAMLALLRRSIHANIAHASREPGLLPRTLDLKRCWVDSIVARRPTEAANAVGQTYAIALRLQARGAAGVEDTCDETARLPATAGWKEDDGEGGGRGTARGTI
ncbi:MAG: FadR/GntR family transcriptional regulator [Chloroflexota bacterium]